MRVSSTAISVALGYKIVDLELHYKALEEILVEKKIITAEEIEEKYEMLKTRDRDKLNDELIKLITEAMENEKQEE